MMMILMTSDDDNFDDIENDSDDIACNHDNEDMMMILMILHAIMIMKIMYEIQHTDFRIIFYHDCDRCLLARTDQQRGPSFDPPFPPYLGARQSLPELTALGWPTCSSLCLVSLGEAPC